MLSSTVSKSLAASAVLATSVATAAGLVPSAQAAPAGPANSPITVADGSSTVLIGGQATTFLSSVAGGAAWSPDGSRIAFVNQANEVVTARPDGSWPFVVAPNKNGAVRQHPTWIMGGTSIAFTEIVGGQSTIEAVQAYTPSDQVPTEGPVLSMLGGPVFTVGTESEVDSNGGSIAFQHHDAATNVDQVYIQDGFGRGTGGPHLVGNGTDPTLSPDGTKVAYLVKDGTGAEQIWVAGWDAQNSKPGAAAVQITSDAHDHLHPTWSPDGSRIAFENAGPAGGAPIDVQSVDGAGHTQKQESATPGVPAYQPLVRNKLERLSGQDRIGTAIATSQAAWPAATAQYPANAVVLSRSDQFADALGGATLANSASGPLLLTPIDHLDAGVKAEIARVLGPANASKTVYVLGGEKALSPAVYNAVAAMGYTVKRVQGADRYATSVQIAKEVVGQNGPERVLVATGNNFADALTAGAAAGAATSFGPPLGVVVLTNDKTMPASTATYLAQVNSGQYKPQIYGIGGQADTALTASGIAHTKVAGSDRYQTSAMVARTFFTGFGGEGSAPSAAGFATALSWPDALSGGAFMAKVNGPLLLINPVSNGMAGNLAGPIGDEQAFLSGWSGGIDTAYVFGGVGAVGDLAANNSAGFVSGPAGFDSVANPKA